MNLLTIRAPRQRARSAERHTMAALVSEAGRESIVRWYARLITGRPLADRRVLRLDRKTTECGPAERGGEVRLAVKKLGNGGSVGFLVADWDRDMEHLQSLLQCAAELDIPAVLARQASLAGIRRVVVASSGGPHASRQMWIAREMSEALNATLRVVRLVPTADGDDTADAPSAHARAEAALESWTSGLLGIDAPTEILQGPNPVQGIINVLRLGDILVMGVPGPFHISEGFSESIPVAIAQRIRSPIVLLRTRSPEAVSLRNVFWGGLAQPALHLRDKHDAICALVDALIEHHQVPLSTRGDLVARAFQREWVMSTAVDCETAFPHIRLPGFRGVAGSMLICPDGVDFDSTDGSLTRFIFLLVTPDGYCDEHLTIQARIARRMLRPEVRAALLECATPEDILHVLEPCVPT